MYNTIMKERVVLDTNVVLSAFKSKNGAPYELLRRLAEDQFEIAISVPLIMEYEEILKAKLDESIFSTDDIDTIINYFCKIGVTAEIFYLWRPCLKDPEDDHILELAVAANCSCIVTYNKKDFAGIERFGLQTVDAAEFLEMLRKDPDYGNFKC